MSVYKFSSSDIWLGLVIILYHSFFTCLFYNLSIVDPSDSNFYWLSSTIDQKSSWSSHIGIGNDFIRLLNYPLAVGLKLPLWSGFLLYSAVGLWTIVLIYKLFKQVVKVNITFFGISILPAFLFLPNFHFWTAGITKEVICVLCITMVFIQIHQSRWISWRLILSTLVLAALRPHVALMLWAGIGTAYLVLTPLSRKFKLLYALGVLIMLLIFYLMVCNIININPWDIKRWILNNERWRDSFIGSGSYVPIQDYNYLYKYFTFFFRPFFYDVNHPYGWVLSFENLIIFMLFVWISVRYLFYYSKITWNVTLLSMLLFNSLGAFIYVQRYAGLGIFARTRMMFVPFLIIVLFYILKQNQIKDNSHYV